MTPSPSCTQSHAKHLLCIAVFFLIIVGSGVFLVVSYGRNVRDKPRWDQNDQPPFDYYDDDDTWGDGSHDHYTDGEFSQWKNEKNGLQLKIQNALTSDWDEYFFQAVTDWNKAPALLLDTGRSNPDLMCSSVMGIMKVCNDDYGKTGWTSISELYFDKGNNIASSVAKMNDTYLKDASNPEKQFAMCHEIGHGVGLPHRNENANNADLGSCLDYTFRFENNMQPDSKVDFDNLERMYGRRPGSRRSLASETPRTSISSMLWNEKSTEKREDHVEEIQPNANWQYKAGRLLHQSKHREVYENHLGNGRRVVTTILLPQDDAIHS